MGDKIIITDDDEPQPPPEIIIIAPETKPKVEKSQPKNGCNGN